MYARAHRKSRSSFSLGFTANALGRVGRTVSTLPITTRGSFWWPRLTLCHILGFSGFHVSFSGAPKRRVPRELILRAVVLFPTYDAPKYKYGYQILILFGGIALLSITAMKYLYSRK